MSGAWVPNKVQGGRGKTGSTEPSDEIMCSQTTMDDSTQVARWHGDGAIVCSEGDDVQLFQ
jgi:hypothetical protein